MIVLHWPNWGGLGDTVQFSACLSHLKAYRPEWENHVYYIRERAHLFHLADSFHATKPKLEAFDKVIPLEWLDGFEEFPFETKVGRALQECYGITPDPAYLRYTTPILNQEAVDRWLEHLRSPFIVLHHQGAGSLWQKNIPAHVLQPVVNALSRTYTVVLIDHLGKSELENVIRFNLPYQCLAALFARSAFSITIASGPMYVSLAVGRPSIVVWWKHHPLNYIDLGNGGYHLLPTDHLDWLRGDKRKGLVRLHDNYDYDYYDGLENLPARLIRSCTRISTVGI
jgi:ADP-heptose:LPS heptosyltransferase